jgi:hypothetical protein
MNAQSKMSSPRGGQRGAVLLLAMIFLLLLAMIAGTTMHTSILEFRMAGNDQFREEAFQKAQAVATALSQNAANFPVTGGVGYTICKAGDSDAACNISSINVPAAVAAVPAGVTVEYRVQRQGPMIMESLPFRQSQSEVSSSLAFDAALFEAAVAVDGSAVRLGRAEVAQGVARLVASSAQGQ